MKNTMQNKIKKMKSNTSSAIKKLKLLVTIVDKSKTLFYVDLLEEYEINMQMVLYGKGTANSEMLHYLGLDESAKAIILSFVKEERIKDVLDTLSLKFEKVKNGKGIAYTIPMQSVIGTSIYQFLSNQPMIKKGD